MPNHTSNKLLIKGKLSEIQKILEHVSGKDTEGKEREFTFNKITPQPNEVEDWYEWRYKNWNTKWDAYNLKIESNIPAQSIQYILDDDAEGEVKIYFTTAWSPICKLIKKLVKKYKLLKFEYGCIGEGKEFYKKETYKKGLLIKESENFKTVEKFFRR